MARSKSAARAGRAWLRPGALIGMVHLPPLPGSPRSAEPMAAIVRRAVSEARLLADCGFDALMIENYGDAPFHAEVVPAETVAAMAVAAAAVRSAVTIPLGINVLRNDALAALAVAAACGAEFIRVNVLSGVYAADQGILTGRGADVARQRVRLAPRVRIAADVHVKHAAPISQPDIARAAADTAYRALADALIVTGAATGHATPLEDVERIRGAVPDRPVWVGSGVTAGTVGEVLRVADGVIVGTCLKRGGRTEAGVDAAAARRFVRAARRG